MPRALLALAALALAGCSSFHSAEELRGAVSEGSVVLPVQARGDESGPGRCGLACLGALLRFHGLDLDAEARARFPALADKEGSIGAGEIRDYLRQRGLRAYLVHGTLDASEPHGLLHVLALELPAIVALHAGTQDHFVLACGFEPERRWVFVLDPERGIGGVPFDDFDRRWAGADRLMLVAAR